jgi:phosphonate transport system substrate-binding protein
LLGALALGAGLAAGVAAAQAGTTNDAGAIRFAFSKGMLSNVNEEDAKAAMKVYTQTMADENHVSVNSEPLILDGTNAIAEAMRGNQFDMITLTAEEYLAVDDQGLEDPFLLSEIDGRITEEYVLLARADGPIKTVADLPGGRLILANDTRASLAALWLDVLCREHGLGAAGAVFASRTVGSKPAQVVLPVFFGKADVCVTTRKGFGIMGELNPQVTHQLRVIAQSPPVIPGFSCFRRGVSEAIKQRLVDVASHSADQPAFKQMMSLFKTDKLDVVPVSALAGTRELVAHHQALVQGQANQPGVAAGGSELRKEAARK